MYTRPSRAALVSSQSHAPLPLGRAISSSISTPAGSSRQRGRRGLPDWFWWIGITLILTGHVGCRASSQRSRPSDFHAGPAAARKNPFEAVEFYRNPKYTEHVVTMAHEHPPLRERILKVATYPTALWIDSIARVPDVTVWLDDARRQQEQIKKPVLTVFVIYDLPNRDCAAKASAGELLLSDNGESRYKSEFIDPIAKQFREHPGQPIVAILEPDSLANLATNLGNRKCAESADAYMRSVAYAISRLSQEHVSVYLDAAHAGWIGWDDNRSRLARVFKRVLQMAGGAELIRGFATNVANYNTVSGRDGKKLDASNPCPDELSYVRRFSDTLKRIGIKRKGFIIDTARNGRGNIRHRWGSWCNVKGAGLGERPRATPDDSPLDAYFWVKPPGESDGVADPTAPRYDSSCRSDDSALDAPQAGTWYPSYFLELVKNAEPPLE